MDLRKIFITDAEMGFTQSSWSATAEAASVSAALVGDVSADAMIVGFRFTGHFAALQLAKMGQSVVVVEAKYIGWVRFGLQWRAVNLTFHIRPSGARAHYYGARGNRILALVDGACDLVLII